MSNRFRILHLIVFAEHDYDHGDLVLMFMDEDRITEVASIPFVRNQFYVDEFRKYMLHGVSSN